MAQGSEQDVEVVPTEPAEPVSGSPPSSPTRAASFRAQKRRLEAASSAETQDIFIHFPTHKRRRTTPRTVFRYSPLPPSFPLPPSSEPCSPNSEHARLSPVAEEAPEAEAQPAVVDSDPDWFPNDSTVEKINVNGDVVNEAAKPPNVSVTPPRSSGQRLEQPLPPEVLRGRLEAIFPYYVPPRTSELDIPMNWPPRSDEVAAEEGKDKDKDENMDDENAAAGQDAGVDAEQDEAEAEASMSFGESVSAAIVRAKAKAKAQEKAKQKEEQAKTTKYVREDRGKDKEHVRNLSPNVRAGRRFWLDMAPPSPDPNAPKVWMQHDTKERMTRLEPSYDGYSLG